MPEDTIPPWTEMECYQCGQSYQASRTEPATGPFICDECETYERGFKEGELNSMTDEKLIKEAQMRVVEYIDSIAAELEEAGNQHLSGLSGSIAIRQATYLYDIVNNINLKFDLTPRNRKKKKPVVTRVDPRPEKLLRAQTQEKYLSGEIESHYKARWEELVQSLSESRVSDTAGLELNRDRVREEIATIEDDMRHNPTLYKEEK